MRCFGLSATAAQNIFMKAVVREKRIPFEIRADNEEIVRNKARKAFLEMRNITAENFDHKGMPIDEINAEIKAVRDMRL